MNLARSFAFTLVPLAVVAGACGGTSSSSGSLCSLDPACYEIESSGECTLDPGAVCVEGVWQCSPHGTLGSGCLPDGGIAPPPVDAGPQDSGVGPDGCVGAGCDPVCTLPSFTITCSGPGDPVCSQYGSAFCSPAPAGGYECSCEALSDPPHNACPLDCTSICPPGTIGADCVVEPDGGYGCDCASGGLGGP